MNCDVRGYIGVSFRQALGNRKIIKDSGAYTGQNGRADCVSFIYDVAGRNRYVSDICHERAHDRGLCEATNDVNMVDVESSIGKGLQADS